MENLLLYSILVSLSGNDHGRLRDGLYLINFIAKFLVTFPMQFMDVFRVPNTMLKTNTGPYPAAST